MGQSGHVERVGHHDSLKSEFMLEQVADDRRRSCGHTIGVRFESRNSNVRHHDRIDSRRDGLAEGRQFHRIQARPVSGDLGHAEVGIGRGIAMAGKMFGRSHHSAGARSPDVRRHEISHLPGILTERARIDNWVRRIGVHVGVGKEIPVHADGAGLLGSNAAEGLGVLLLPSRAEGHGVGKRGCAAKAHGDPALKIGGEEQRQFGILLQAVEQFGSFVGLTAIEKWRLPRHRHGE